MAALILGAKASRWGSRQINSNKTNRPWFLAALLLAMAISAGCVSLGARALKSLFSDPRTKNHEFYERVEISFYINGMKVRAVRYADVYSLNGNGNSYFPPCDRTKPTCWKQTEHYFIGLPNGDIGDIFIGANDLILPELVDGRVVNAKATLTALYRDQPQSNNARENGSCLSISRDDFSKTYGDSKIEISASLTKIGQIPQGHSVVDVDRLLENQIFDKESCKYLLNKFSLSDDVSFQ